jgi:hypothetical protein
MCIPMRQESSTSSDRFTAIHSITNKNERKFIFWTAESTLSDEPGLARIWYSVGARVAGWMWCGPSWSPVGGETARPSTSQRFQATGGGRPQQGEDKPSPIRTNLRMAELDFKKSQRLPRPWRSLRLEEICLLTLALLPGSLLQRDVPWSICSSVPTLTGACDPRERVWHTASPHPSAAVLLRPGQGRWLLAAPLAFPHR